MQDAGFDAQLHSGDGEASAGHVAQELNYWWRLYTSALLFTLPIMFITWILPSIPGGGRLHRLSDWACAVHVMQRIL